MNSQFRLFLFALFAFSIPCNSFSQTIHIKFGEKKASKETEDELQFESNSYLTLPEFTGLGSFAEFAPENAELLFVLRPKQLFEFPALKAGWDSALAMAASNAPVNMSEVELIMVAASRQTIDDLFTHRAQQQFTDIASALNGEIDDVQATEIHSTAEQLNENFCGLIRFSEAASWSNMNDVMDIYGGSETFDVRQWRGLEVLVSKNKKCCTTVRIDERTFLICNRQELVAGLGSKAARGGQVVEWLKQLSNFSGELHFASKVTSDDVPAEFFPAGSVWATMGQIQDFRFSFGLNEGNLLDVDCGFADQETAKLFITRMQSSLHEFHEMMNVVNTNESPEFMVKQMQQAKEILSSIKLSSADGTAKIVLPRPDNLEKQLEECFDGWTQAQQASMTEFSGIEAELGRLNSQGFDGVPDNANETRMASIVVVTRTISAGEIITAEDINKEDWPAQLIPEDSFQDAQSVIGKRASNKMHRGMPVMKANIEKAN